MLNSRDPYFIYLNLYFCLKVITLIYQFLSGYNRIEDNKEI